MLQRLRRYELFANIEKCEFAVDTVEFLGFIMSTTGVNADPERVRTITDWPTPSCVKDIQRFLGFTNFYRRFVKGYSHIVSPLTELTKKDVGFAWGDAAQEAFTALKTAFTTTPLLVHWNPAKRAQVEADVSIVRIAAILSQPDKDGQWHPTAFVSKKLTPAERNWQVYDLELFAVYYAFKMWRHYLEGAQHTIEVHSDHNNLQGWRGVQALSARQSRFWHYLSAFDFEVFHRPGKLNPADAPSRRPDLEPSAASECAEDALPSMLRRLLSA